MTTATDILLIRQDGPVRYFTLNRSARRNALSRSLVVALRAAFEDVADDGGTRVIVLAGDGPAFCAGGDITEYAEAAASGTAREDAEGLAALLAAMAACPAPIIARVHGAAFGGGVGLVAAADIAIAAEDTRFSLSEARLGLVPATISPYVIAAMGERQAKAHMLLAAPFGADVALRCGLIHQAAPDDELDGAVSAAVANLQRGAPGALATIKRIPSMLRGLDSAAAATATAHLLAERLASVEGREGLHAFLEKRSAAWIPDGVEPK